MKMAKIRRERGRESNSGKLLITDLDHFQYPLKIHFPVCRFTIRPADSFYSFITRCAVIARTSNMAIEMKAKNSISPHLICWSDSLLYTYRHILLLNVNPDNSSAFQAVLLLISIEVILVKMPLETKHYIRIARERERAQWRQTHPLNVIDCNLPTVNWYLPETIVNAYVRSHSIHSPIRLCSLSFSLVLNWGEHFTVHRPPAHSK